MASAVRLYNKHTQAELVAMRATVSADPAPRQNGVRRDMPLRDAIDLAITWHMADTRAAAGDPVRADGYSGRQSRRRR